MKGFIIILQPPGKQPMPYPGVIPDKLLADKLVAHLRLRVEDSRTRVWAVELDTPNNGITIDMQGDVLIVDIDATKLPGYEYPKFELEMEWYEEGDPVYMYVEKIVSGISTEVEYYNFLESGMEDIMIDLHRIPELKKVLETGDIKADPLIVFQKIVDKVKKELKGLEC